MNFLVVYDTLKILYGIKYKHVVVDTDTLQTALPHSMIILLLQKV